jgi:hypothetical protein
MFNVKTTLRLGFGNASKSSFAVCTSILLGLGWFFPTPVAAQTDCASGLTNMLSAGGGSGQNLSSSIASTLTGLLAKSLTGGLGGLAGGLLGGGAVPVIDEKNLEAAKNQIEILKKILAVETLSCLTLQKIVAAIGAAGPAGANQNPMVNLPVYAGKVFAMYRDTSQTADPQTAARLAAAGTVTVPKQGFAAGGPDLTRIIQGTVGSTQNLGNLLNVGGIDLGSLTGLNGLLNSINQALGSVLGDINKLFGGIPTFSGKPEEIKGVIMNIIGSTGNPTIQKIIEGALQQKGGLDQMIRSVLGSVTGNITGGSFNVLKPEDFTKVLNQMLYVNPQNCKGDVNECLKTTANLRAAMATTIANNTFAKNAARGQNLQKEVRELIYGVDDKECPPTSTDKKCVSLLRMMTASASLREDIQTNTAAVLTAMSFQLKELEALAEANIAEAAPSVLTSPAIIAEVGSGDKKN